MTETTVPNMPQDVARVFDSFPSKQRRHLEDIRALIFDVAAAEGVGPVTETLKWGQPSYLVKTGSTLRLGVPKAGGYGLYAHCQTSLISDFAGQFSGDFTIEGNRGVLFRAETPPDLGALRVLIAAGLTYKRK